MRCLIDTCVVSEVYKPAPNRNVIDFLGTQAEIDLFLPAIVIGEIRKGIELARPGKPEHAGRLEVWLGRLQSDYGHRILAFDSAAAEIWGRLMAANPQSGVEDAQIAAIAMAHGLVVVTRNIRDFATLGAPMHDPFAEPP